MLFGRIDVSTDAVCRKCPLAASVWAHSDVCNVEREESVFPGLAMGGAQDHGPADDDVPNCELAH